MKKIYFVTDAHFGAKNGDGGAAERKLVRFLKSVKDDCQALYLMGDMIDFWYEYPHLVPKGYVRFFAQLADFTDAGIPVYWFAGNHDVWLYSYVQQELGVQVVTQPLLTELMGKKFFLAHGDGLGDPSFGVKILTWFFHSPVTQWLFTHVFPTDAGMRLGLAWSHHSYEKRKKSQQAAFLGEDREHLIAFAKQYVKAHSDDVPDYFLFGHRHIVLEFELACGSRLVIPGDWMTAFSYAVFDGEQLYVDFFEA